MTVNQVYQLVNQTAKEAYGVEAITVKDLTGLIAMGNTVLSTDKNKDLFVKALADRIAKTVIQNRVYKGHDRGLLKSLIEYGVAVQEVYVEPEEASINNAWVLTEGMTPDLSAHIPSVKVEIYDNRNTWKFKVSVPDYQLKSAFLNGEEMATFISAIYNAVETSIEASKENLANLCEANFIAEKINATFDGVAGNHSINLLYEYALSIPEAERLEKVPATKEAAIKDPDFLRFAGAEIKKHINKMSNLGVIYNTKQYKRFTNKDDLNVHILTDFAANTATYLQSNTYHKELVELPGYNEVNYWQGQGTNSTFDDVSKINIITSDGNQVEQSGVVAFIFDKEAAGILFDEPHSSSFVDPEHDVTTTWFKSTIGYFNNLSRNAIVFYVDSNYTINEE